MLAADVIKRLQSMLFRNTTANSKHDDDILIASVATLPYMSMCDPPEEIPSSPEYPYSYCTGVEPELLKIFAGHLNVTVKFLQLVNESWGSMLPNGTWNGHIGRILRGEADLGVGSITLTHARHKVVDYTSMVAEDHYVFTVPEPGEMPKFNAFMRPFSLSIWLLILFMTLAVALADFALTKASSSWKSPRSLHALEGRPEDTDSGGTNVVMPFIKSLLFLTTESVEFRGAGVLSAIPLSKAILFGVWLAMSSFIGRIYAAVILAYLLAPAFVPGIETLEDAVLKSNALFVNTKLDGASMEYILMASGTARSSNVGYDSNTISGRQMLFRKVLDQERLKICDIDDAQEAYSCGTPETEFLIVSLRYAEDLEAKASYLYGERIHFAKETLLPSSLAWPIAKTNPLISKLNRMMNQATATGLLAELSRREKIKYYWRQYGGRRSVDAGPAPIANSVSRLSNLATPRVTHDELRILGQEEFSGVLLVIGIGFALSIVVFLGELKLGRKKNLS